MAYPLPLSVGDVLAAGQLLHVLDVDAEVTRDLGGALVDDVHGYSEGDELDACELVGVAYLTGRDAGDDLSGTLHDELEKGDLVDACLLDFGAEIAVVDDVFIAGHCFSSVERVVV